VVGRGAGWALRILSAVQYLRVSLEEVPTECFATFDFEKRFAANRYKPTSRPKRVIPTRGNSFCDCAIMPLSFVKDEPNQRDFRNNIVVTTYFRSNFYRPCFLFPLYRSIAAILNFKKRDTEERQDVLSSFYSLNYSTPLLRHIQEEGKEGTKSKRLDIAKKKFLTHLWYSFIINRNLTVLSF
jgi:hypothetical protein